MFTAFVSAVIGLLQMVVDAVGFSMVRRLEIKTFESFPFLSRKSPICGCVLFRQLTPKIAKDLMQS